jgi:hypothetical protein
MLRKIDHMMKMKNADTKETFLWILFALVVFFVLIYLNVIKPGPALKAALPFLRDCTDVAGTCSANIASCDALNNEATTYSLGLQSCKEKNAICCIPNTPPNTSTTTPGGTTTTPASTSGTTAVQSPECKGHPKGYSCGTPAAPKMCSADSGQCLSVCEYCNKNYDDPQCMNINITFNKYNKFADFKLAGWKCGCDINQCKTLAPSGKCILNPSPSKVFCTTDNSQFCCMQ